MTPTLILLIILSVAALIVFGLVVSFFSVWLRAMLAGAPVSIFNLVAMRVRQVPYRVMVDARIRATKEGIQLSIDVIEAQYLAGGNVIDEAYDAKEGMLVNSGFLNGLDVKDAIPAAIAELDELRLQLRDQFKRRDSNVYEELKGNPG